MTTYARKRTFLPDAPATLPTPTITSQPHSTPTAHHATHTDSILAFFKPLPPAQSSSHSDPPRKKSRLLTQTTIDLGGDPRRTCPKCNMQYLPAAPADVKTHLRFCARATAASSDAIIGVAVGVHEVDGAKVVKRGTTSMSTRMRMIAALQRHGQVRGKVKGQRESHGNEQAYILEISRRSSAAARSLAERLLAVAEEELGAVRVTREALWSMHEIQEGEKFDAFKAYVYVVGGHAVGLCLAQRVWRARRVACPKPDEAKTRPSSTDQSDESRESAIAAFEIEDDLVDGVVMGVSRIWIARDLRRYGLAGELLDAARKCFVLGRPLKQEETAFSQPTESGLRLARKWYGNQSGWLVYDERCEEDRSQSRAQ